MSRSLAVDEASFEREVIRSEQPVLVDFSAAWCGPCKKLEPIVDEIAGDYAGRLKVVTVDVDRAPNLAVRFGVLSVPTLILFRDGSVKDQVLGLVSKSAIAQRVDRVLQAA
jgi:thioredoxin 1